MHVANYSKLTISEIDGSPTLTRLLHEAPPAAQALLKDSWSNHGRLSPEHLQAAGLQPLRAHVAFGYLARQATERGGVPTCELPEPELRLTGSFEEYDRWRSLQRKPYVDKAFYPRGCTYREEAAWWAFGPMTGGCAVGGCIWAGVAGSVWPAFLPLTWLPFGWYLTDRAVASVNLPATHAGLIRYEEGKGEFDLCAGLRRELEHAAMIDTYGDLPGGYRLVDIRNIDAILAKNGRHDEQLAKEGRYLRVVYAEGKRQACLDEIDLLSGKERYIKRQPCDDDSQFSALGLLYERMDHLQALAQAYGNLLPTPVEAPVACVVDSAAIAAAQRRLSDAKDALRATVMRSNPDRGFANGCGSFSTTVI